MAEDKLFSDFPPVPTDAWEAIIREDLKGADYDKKLIWKTPEGFSLRPYYRAEDLAALDFLDSVPGEFPYIRGNQAEGNGWEIRQDVWVDHPSEANQKALAVLNSGVNAIRFCFSKDARAKFLNHASFDFLLRDIALDCISLNFFAGDRAKDILSLLKNYAVKHAINPTCIKGSIQFDVLGHLTESGNYTESEAKDFAHMLVALQKACKHFPGMRILAIDGSLFRSAGSTIVQELAFSLSMTNEYLDRLTEKGIPVDDVFSSLHFTFATGASYFLEIAKLRTARMLISKLAESWKINDKNKARMAIHSVSSTWNKTVFDPYVNMLRVTTEAMSAVLGGSDSLTVVPFDASYRTPSDFSERIARNVQIILKEEAYFDRVADPSAGSYYIENLVNSIAVAAWELFQKIEAAGGYLACLKAGSIQEQVMGSAKSKTTNLNARRDILLGTNRYPNAREKMKEQVREEIAFHRASHGQTLVQPLACVRGAEKFEQMRLKTESREHPPKVFLLTYGNISIRRVRANFSSNFFTVAGFEIIDNIGFKTIAEGIQAAIESKAEIVMVCSSDEEYSVIIPEVFDGLAGVKLPEGKTPVTVVAGAPACMEELKAKGIAHFIHVRSNMLETLQQFQHELGF